MKFVEERERKIEREEDSKRRKSGEEGKRERDNGRQSQREGKWKVWRERMRRK